MARKNTCLIVIGVLLALFGAAVLILGLYVSPKELPVVFKDQVDEYVVVDSEHSEAYTGWAGQNDVDNPYYFVVYMFNLTNVEAVRLNGSVPNYEQVGPYMYRRYRKSENVSFLDDGDLVQYSDFMDFYFDQNASGTLSENDMFTNVNPVYIGALMQATAEPQLVLAAAGGMLSTFTNYFTGPFVTLFTAYNFASYFQPLMNSNIALLNASYPQQGYSMFVDTWRNGTTAPTVGNWTGLLLNGNTPANISVYSAQKLLSATQPYSLLDTSLEAIWYWDQSVNNATIAQNLTNMFQITTQQLSILWNWRNMIFGPTIMYPTIIAHYGLDTINDIGWVQYVTLDGLDGLSVANFTDSVNIGVYMPIELGAYGSTGGANWSEWRMLLNPTTGLENITNVQIMLNDYLAGITPNVSGLNANTAGALLGYIADPTFMQYQVVPTIIENTGPTGGLYVTRSVNEWAFNCDDYLLNLLREDPPSCALRYNHTSKAPNTIHTGKKNISQINNYEIWQGQSTVYFWQTPLNISGFTELGQFQPDYDNKEPYPVFQEDTARIIYLNYTSQVTVEGITADRYILDFSRTFGISEYFGQTINGLANLTNVQFGSPIFVSLWDMLYVNASIANVTGLNATNEWDDNTIIDVEPTTGITVNCRRRMQVNVYVPNDNNAWYGGTSFFNNENFFSGIAYPVAKVGEFATIGASSASKLRDKLAIPPKVRHATFYVGVIAGPILIVIGASLVFLSRKKHHHHKDEHERLVVNRH